MSPLTFKNNRAKAVIFSDDQCRLKSSVEVVEIGNV